MKVKVTNIKWKIDCASGETYEQAVKQVGLPTEVVMDYPMDDYPNEDIELSDEELSAGVISDKLSELYEWLPCSFDFKKTK